LWIYSETPKRTQLVSDMRVTTEHLCYLVLRPQSWINSTTTREQSVCIYGVLIRLWKSRPSLEKGC